MREFIVGRDESRETGRGQIRLEQKVRMTDNVRIVPSSAIHLKVRAES